MSGMKKTGQCPKCQSTDVVGDAEVVPNEKAPAQPFARVGLRTHVVPNASLMKDTWTTEVRAWGCRACGYVELYAQHPGALKHAR